MAAKKPGKTTSPHGSFSDEERAAMKERAQELKASAGKVEGERDLLAKIAALPAPERAMALRLHALIKTSAPSLSAKTWYGMPAWARDGEVVCFFQAATKFKTRYASFGFSDKAKLDDGALWPTAFALQELTSAAETMIAALVKKAAG